MAPPLITPQAPGRSPADAGDYGERCAASRGLFERALAVIAGGTTHDGWSVEPFPVYVREARGPYKWDVSGRRMVDYWMGHGALILGHSFPPVVNAVAEQASRGTHFGAPSELEVHWAEAVCSLIPSAERVRFTSSGTEATMLALRAARAFTGRDLVVKLDGHFHGWHDESLAHFIPSREAGISEGAASQVIIADPFSAESVEELLAGGDIAAVILEPGGGGSGGLPWGREYLLALREATRARGTLLIFDEVVSAFRYSPGGVQELCGVLPDVTVLAKILSGGLPGGAVAGRAEVMAVFGGGTVIGGRAVRVPHTGTFNGNPLSAAAGTALLAHVADGAAQRAAEVAAQRLVGAVNEAADERGVDVRLYRQSSIFHILIGAAGDGAPTGPSEAVITLYARRPELYAALRRALLFEGIDTHPIHGWVSAVHDDAAIEETAEAFDRAFHHLRGVPGFAC
jgi:glutamate-1-semialdehyde 2,1-aminomutase